MQTCRRIATGIVACLIVWITAVPVVMAKGKLTKYWYHGSGALRGWQFRYVDGWGGSNYWCVSGGWDCWQYDWKAEYPLSVGSGGCEPQTPATTNNAAYGEYLIANEAAASGITLPSDLGSVSYSVSCDEGLE